jgi:prepilin-type N-terminal cleavage/methylation domain-containing protein/prepilin-type processing-associated H-X9-DG protein
MFVVFTFHSSVWRLRSRTRQLCFHRSIPNEYARRARLATNRARIAFTLVELLVVIAIIGVLVALLLPAVQAAREAARRTQCTNKVKQLTLGLLNYESARKEFPSGGITPGSAVTERSHTNWAIETLPYIEQQALYDLYQQKPAFNDDAINQAVVQTKLTEHSCPSDTNVEFIDTPATWASSVPASGPGKFRMSSYRACSGRVTTAGGSGIFTGPVATLGKATDRGVLSSTGHLGMRPVKLRQITDGTSKTLLVGESATRSQHRRNTFWAYTHASYNKAEVYNESRTLLDDYDDCCKLGSNDNPCKRLWTSQHPGGFHFSMCDGSVGFISSEVDIYLLTDLATMAGGEDRVSPY